MSVSRWLKRKPGRTIAVLALIQVLTATYFLRIHGFFEAASILFFACGIGIGVLVLNLNPVEKSESVTPKRRRLLLTLITSILLFPLSYWLAAKIMAGTPLQKEFADMLPIMKVMGRRFLSGDWRHVYDPIPEIWDGVQPIYLPAFWLPFTPAVAFSFDARWITVVSIWLSSIMIIWSLTRATGVNRILCVLSLLVLLAWLHFDKVNNVIRLTEEGVVFFYYCALVTAILSGRAWLVGITAALCLLSRYAMIGWIPFALLYLLLTRRYRYLAIASASGALVILLLVIIPFGWKPFAVHFQLHAEYISHASRIWKSNPEYYYQSLGMAKFFGPNRIRLLHLVLVGGSFLVPLCFTALVSNKGISRRMAFLCCLQCSITFFYSFIDVSYLYLYYTPVFVSLLIAASVGNFATRKVVHLRSSSDL
jgi:hypothetical protein